MAKKVKPEKVVKTIEKRNLMVFGCENGFYYFANGHFGIVFNSFSNEDFAKRISSSHPDFNPKWLLELKCCVDMVDFASVLKTVVKENAIDVSTTFNLSEILYGRCGKKVDDIHAKSAGIVAGLICSEVYANTEGTRTADAEMLLKLYKTIPFDNHFYISENNDFILIPTQESGFYWIIALVVVN